MPQDNPRTWPLTILALIFAAVLLLGKLCAMGEVPGQIQVPDGYEIKCIKGKCFFVQILDRIRDRLPLAPFGPPNPSVVRVGNFHAGGTSWGSGAAIEWDGQPLIVTVAHLFSDGIGNISVSLPGGAAYPAELVGIDRTYDLAVLRSILNVPPLTIATEIPQQGDRALAIGFGERGQYRATYGRVLGYARTPGTDGNQTLEIIGHARDGDSGGPMLNDAGQLIGILWGTDGRRILGSYCGRITRFLQEHIEPGETLTAPLAPLVPTVPAGPVVEQEPLVVATPEKPVTLPLPFAIEIQVPQTPQGASDVASETTPGPPASSLSGAAGALSLGTWDTLIALALPALIAGLGWTGPPAIALAFGIRALPAVARWGRSRGRARRQRKRRKAEAAGTFRQPPDPVEPIGTIPRDTTEAEQLLQLSELEGRSAILDALAGRVAFDELDKTIHKNPTGPEADWARDFRRFLLDKCHEIIPPAVTVNQSTQAQGT